MDIENDEILYSMMDLTLLETEHEVLANKFNKLKESTKKAQQKYASNNREKINTIQRAYYRRNKEKPAFKLRKKQQNKTYRERQHLKKIVEEENIQPFI